MRMFLAFALNYHTCTGTVAWNPAAISRHDLVNPGLANDRVNFLAASTRMCFLPFPSLNIQEGLLKKYFRCYFPRSLLFFFLSLLCF